MCQCEEVNKTTEVKEKYDAGLTHWADFFGARARDAKEESASKQFADAFQLPKTTDVSEVAKKMQDTTAYMEAVRLGMSVGEACVCGLKQKVKELLQTLIHTGTQDARVTDLVMECSALLEAN